MRHRPAVGNPGSRDGPAVEGPVPIGRRRRARGAPGCQTPPHAPPRARERQVGDGREPASSARRASSRCAMRSPDGQVGVDRRARSSSGRAGRRAARAARRPARRARRRGARARARGRSRRAARAPRGRRGRRAARPTRAPPGAGARALRAHDVRAAVGVELGDHPGVREAAQRHRQRERLDGEQQRARPDERDDVRRRRRGPRAAVRSRRRSSTRARQWTAGARAGPRRVSAATGSVRAVA